ncbi:hypothetical protein ACJX0J_009658 [Zea mays]
MCVTYITAKVKYERTHIAGSLFFLIILDDLLHFEVNARIELENSDAVSPVPHEHLYMLKQANKHGFRGKKEEIFFFFFGEEGGTKRNIDISVKNAKEEKKLAAKIHNSVFFKKIWVPRRESNISSNLPKFGVSPACYDMCRLGLVIETTVFMPYIQLTLHLL